jgi:two-component system chemotaxis sensor kinase CheA
MASSSDDFLKRLQAAFTVEAAEHCQALSTGLLDLENAPEERRRGLIENIFRSAHSLKGAARAVSLTTVEAICQRLETVFDSWRRGRSRPKPTVFDVLHRAVSRVHELVQTPPAEIGANNVIANLLAEIDRLDERIAEPANATVGDATTAQPGIEAASEASVTPILPATSQVPVPNRPLVAGNAEALPSETIRVATAKVERVLYATEELLALKSILAQRVSDLHELVAGIEYSRREWSNAEATRPGLHNIESTSELAGAEHDSRLQSMSELTHRTHESNRVLEQKLAALARLLEHDRHTLGKSVDNLLDEAKRLLLLPFATEAGFYTKLVRDLARDQGKQIDFVFCGGDVEVDKRIIEEMKDALVHLLRNAVDHGVESPAARIADGKPARGTVTLAASRINGQKVEILIKDDGAGINFDAVRKAVVRHGIVPENAAAKLSDDEALGFIFRSEITTAPMVTEVSGRGVGLAIVEEKVDRLSGRLTVQTERGGGTSFRVVLPVAQATFRGVLVSVAEQMFVIPAAMVERVHRASIADIKRVENRETITLEDRAVSFVGLGEVLNLPRRASGDASPKFVETVVIGSRDCRVAFGVDGVLREEEVLVKPLRKPLCRVRNIAGATVLGSGRVVLILNAADLLKSAIGASSRTSITESQPKVEPKRRSILVVEDSITSRMLLKNILESAGYAVKTAVDGLDGITTLRSEPFDLVVSDVEMPRLNGFGLTTAIRADRRLAEIPVILVTALASRENRERGIDAGANAYLVKSDFDQSNLLEAVRRFV